MGMVVSERLHYTKYKSGQKSDNLFWMEDKDLVLFIKEWRKNLEESK